MISMGTSLVRSTIQHRGLRVLGLALCLIVCGCVLAPRPKGLATGAGESSAATTAPETDAITVMMGPRRTDEDGVGDRSASSNDGSDDGARRSTERSTAVVDVKVDTQRDAQGDASLVENEAERYRDVDLARIFERRSNPRPLPLHNEDPTPRRGSRRDPEPRAEPAPELSVSTNGPERPAASTTRGQAPDLSGKELPPSRLPRSPYRPVRTAPVPRAVRVT